MYGLQEQGEGPRVTIMNAQPGCARAVQASGSLQPYTFYRNQNPVLSYKSAIPKMELVPKSETGTLSTNGLLPACRLPAANDSFSS